MIISAEQSELRGVNSESNDEQRHLTTVTSVIPALSGLPDISPKAFIQAELDVFSRREF